MSSSCRLWILSLSSWILWSLIFCCWFTLIGLMAPIPQANNKHYEQPNYIEERHLCVFTVEWVQIHATSLHNGTYLTIYRPFDKLLRFTSGVKLNTDNKKCDLPLMPPTPPKPLPRGPGRFMRPPELCCCWARPPAGFRVETGTCWVCICCGCWRRRCCCCCCWCCITRNTFVTRCTSHTKWTLCTHAQPDKTIRLFLSSSESLSYMCMKCMETLYF